jgi:hypothetical protein
MPTPYEIGRAGEGYAVDDLKRKGFTIDKWDTHASGLGTIEAHEVGEKMLVLVKSALSDEPSDISAKEQRDIQSHAAKTGAVAWEAKVIVNTNLDLIGDIRWRQLD